MTPSIPPHTWSRKFAVAFEGLSQTFRTQSSMRVHSICSVLVVALAAVTGVSLLEWAALFLAIGLVIGMELFNTAIEAIVDLISPEHTELARITKDAAAAAVLVSAMTSVLVGCVVFIPHWGPMLGLWK